jgi:CBS domain-containing membrane protein
MRFDAFLTHARAWLPGRTTIDARERLRAVAGAGLGLLVTALLSHWLAGPLHASVWLIAPLGASAVLVFAVPASPLAQPWSVIGGNTLSALVGIACASWIPDRPSPPPWRWPWPSA